MKHRLAAFLVERAARWSRHPWMGDAMRAEFQAAAEDGHAVRFALGCAWASLGALPAEYRGVAIAIRVLVALVLAVPFAILEFNGARLAIQFLATGENHYYSWLMHGDAAHQAMGVVYRQATPLIALMLATMGLCQLSLMWLMCRSHPQAAHRVAQCAVVAGLVIAMLVLRITADSYALAIYLCIPMAQWCLVRWLGTRTTA